MLKHRLYCLPLLLVLVFSVQADNSDSRLYSVHFTTPGVSDTESAVRDYFCRVVKSARVSIDGAFFKIDSPEVIVSLAEQAAKGVRVRIVTDDSQTSTEVIRHLKSKGVAVEVDGRSSFMHNKFMIVDSAYVWTGSTNVTTNGFTKNNNNSILIKSPELAVIYGYEFREMFEFGVYSNRKEQTFFPLPDNHYYVKIGETHINCYFSPDDDIERILLKRILKAKTSVAVMAFSFTSDSIGEALLTVHKKGIKVSAIFESRGAGSKYSEYAKLKAAGVRVMRDKNSMAMHHKVIIIDGETVIAGSYNFSKNAAKRNDENILIIKNKKIAELYEQEFVRLYD
ncbi:MAG: phospholipase D-like domain-containing protein [Spirochaetes bacterium]|jgi:phosphatidylserine/phosphatidylglycerophosphate/cardiolipin synthase-like enzyme|nr:phospholipase D-like domain-containing protein [Spirochaetota bacterium]